MIETSVAVLVSGAQTAALAKNLNLPALSAVDENYEFLFIENNGVLSLCWQTPKQPVMLSIDFLAGQLAYRQKQSLHKEAIIKAIGVKGDYRPTVIDTTAGLGRDAFIMASMGCQVTLIERQPIIAALLQDGLTRLLREQALAMQLVQTEALTFLESLLTPPDVIYLDPMFPPRNKSALVKKDMQILQRLTEQQAENNIPLFEMALQCARKRIVVKRPDYAPPLANKAADFMIKTTHHRFDIYRGKQDPCL